MKLFQKRKVYEGNRIDLVEKQFISEKQAYDHIPTVYYDILLHGQNRVIGDIDLRLKMNEYMYYYGSVGYRIKLKYQGNHYATDACEMVFKIALEEYKLKELILTCNPDNYASKKTLERLGLEWIERVDVPKSHELYWRGDKEKEVYRKVLKDGESR